MNTATRDNISEVGGIMSDLDVCGDEPRNDTDDQRNHRPTDDEEHLTKVPSLFPSKHQK